MFSPELWATRNIERFGNELLKQAERVQEGRKTRLSEWFALNSTVFGAVFMEMLAMRGSEVRVAYDTPELLAAAKFTTKGAKGGPVLTHTVSAVGSFLSLIPGILITGPSVIGNGAFNRKSIRPKNMSATEAIQRRAFPKGIVLSDNPHSTNNPTEQEMRNYAIGPAQEWEVKMQTARDILKKLKKAA